MSNNDILKKLRVALQLKNTDIIEILKALELGFVFNGGQDGHRIGDFPHHVHFRGGLAECEEVVVPNAWILEIHLWGPEKKYGAFFEDILTNSSL